MKLRASGLIAMAAVLVLPAVIQAQIPMDTAFTYQGLLKQSGSPLTELCDFQFALYNAVSGGSQIGPTQTKSTVTVRNGLFVVSLDFGPAFQGDKIWLDIQARCPSSSSYVALSPRQQMTATPYALGLPGLHTEMNAESPNIIGGRIGNGVPPGVVGAVIGGGGSPTWCGSSFTDPCPNRVTDNFGVVGGGFNNQAGDNAGSVYTAANATVGGGSSNTAGGGNATVGGGFYNSASGNWAMVGGGGHNTASNDYATVGGGDSNTASGKVSAVPGGTGAVASHYAEMAYAGGTFANNGDAQTSLYVLRNTTSNSTKTYLFLDGSTAGNRITVASGRAMIFEIQVIGASNAGLTAGYRIRGVLKSSCGTMTMVGASGDVVGVDSGAASWNATAEADDVNDALAVAVTGAAGISIRWVASVRTTEVAWPAGGCILP